MVISQMWLVLCLNRQLNLIMIDCQTLVLSCNCTMFCIFIGTMYVVFVYAMIVYFIQNDR